MFNYHPNNHHRILYVVHQLLLVVVWALLLQHQTVLCQDNNILIEEAEVDVVIEQDHVVAVHGMETVDLAFENIQLVLTTKKKKKKTNSKQSTDDNNNSNDGKKIILDGSICGRAKPGRMLAIMGPSGAGKSSVLHAIAGRIRYNKNLQLYGTRYINGIEVAGDSFIPSALIEQDVNFFPYMTVQETIEFRVELKLGSLISQQARDTIVHDLMEQMGLTEVADTIIGNNKVRGISGGERKRLSIAVELISSPSLLLLDEPTSGLDSTAATTLVHYLRNLADNGNKTIIAVIHQPSQHVFAKFDDILLVSEGKQMYYGERDKVREYMDDHGCRAPIEMGTAEHILDCITPLPIGDNETAARAHMRVHQLANTARSTQIDLGIIKQEMSNNKHGLKKFLASQHGPRANILVQCNLLLKRSLHQVFRGKTAIKFNLIKQVTTAFVYGAIYSLTNNQASIIDRFGLLNIIAIQITNQGLVKTIRSFPREKTIVSAELSSKMYRTTPYFIAKAISEIPMAGLLTGIFGTIVYQLTGLNRQAGKFRNFLALSMLHGIVNEAAGLFVGAFSPNSDVAFAVFPLLVVVSAIFDGRNTAEENIPRYLRWISKVGLIRWGFEGLCINEFTGLEFDSKVLNTRGPVTKTGTDALVRFGMGNRKLSDILRAQILLASTFWMLSFLGLTLTKQKYEAMLHPPDI